MTKAQHSLTGVDSDLEFSTDRASFAAIGELIGTSRESARSILNKTLLKLRHHPELREFNPHKQYGSL